MPTDTPPAAAADTSTPSGKITRASAYALRQLDDALTLSGYAVSAGVQTSAGGPLSFADIGLIQGTAAKLGVFDPPAEGEGPSSSSVTASEWIDFEQAYTALRSR